MRRGCTAEAASRSGWDASEQPPIGRERSGSWCWKTTCAWTGQSRDGPRRTRGESRITGGRRRSSPSCCGRSRDARRGSLRNPHTSHSHPNRSWVTAFVHLFQAVFHHRCMTVHTTCIHQSSRASQIEPLYTSSLFIRRAMIVYKKKKKRKKRDSRSDSRSDSSAWARSPGTNTTGCAAAPSFARRRCETRRIFPPRRCAG